MSNQQNPLSSLHKIYRYIIVGQTFLLSVLITIGMMIRENKTYSQTTYKIYLWVSISLFLGLCLVELVVYLIMRFRLQKKE